MSDRGPSLRTMYDDEEEQRPSRRRSRGAKGGRMYFGAAIAVAVIVIVVVAGFLLFTGGGDSKEPAAVNHSLPKIYVPTSTNSELAGLRKRSDDKRPLNEAEVFDDVKKLTHDTYTFDLVKSDLSNDCKAVTWGGQLQRDLARHGCTQVARGAYLSQDKKYAGQFIAINLKGIDGSKQILRDLDPDSSAGFVVPLAAPGMEKFGGFSAAYTKPFGHYVVISWVERAGGAKPKTMNELVGASIAIEQADGFVWERLVLAQG